MDAQAEYIVRIPAAALRPRRPREGQWSTTAPIARVLRDVLAVLSADPPLLRPGKFSLYVRDDGAYYRIRVEVPEPRDGDPVAPPALPGATPPPADANGGFEVPSVLSGWGGMRRVADGLWEITPYLPDVDGW